MPQQVISIGAAANDGTGNNLRAAGDMINDNFSELYGELGHAAVPYAATINSDAALYRSFVIAPLTGGVTLANPTNLVARMTLTWRFQQDATGGRLITFGSMFKFSYGIKPALTTSPNAKDLLTAFFDGTDLLASLTPDFR